MLKYIELKTDQSQRGPAWMSGVKKDASDRHWAGSGKVAIEASAFPEYLELIGAEKLDESRLQVIGDLPETDPGQFHALENEPLEQKRGRRNTH